MEDHSIRELQLVEEQFDTIHGLDEVLVGVPVVVVVGIVEVALAETAVAEIADFAAEPAVAAAVDMADTAPAETVFVVHRMAVVVLLVSHQLP